MESGSGSGDSARSRGAEEEPDTDGQENTSIGEGVYACEGSRGGGWHGTVDELLNRVFLDEFGIEKVDEDNYG